MPDARTVDSFIGVAHEDRIRDSLRREVEDRAGTLEPHSDEYWSLVAEIAIEHISSDMVREATARGTAFDRG